MGDLVDIKVIVSVSCWNSKVSTGVLLTKVMKVHPIVLLMPKKIIYDNKAQLELIENISYSTAKREFFAMAEDHVYDCYDLKYIRETYYPAENGWEEAK